MVMSIYTVVLYQFALVKYLVFHSGLYQRRCDDLVMQKWYWFGRSANVLSGVDRENEVIDYGDAAAFFEPTVSGRNVGIKIRNLTKVSISGY